MAMDGAVATEEQNDVGLIGGGGHADVPCDFRRLGILKRLEVVGGTSQAEDGGGAHVREGSRIGGGDALSAPKRDCHPERSEGPHAGWSHFRLRREFSSLAPIPATLTRLRQKLPERPMLAPAGMGSF